jgi:hypothetical protein
MMASISSSFGTLKRVTRLTYFGDMVRKGQYSQRVTFRTLCLIDVSFCYENNHSGDSRRSIYRMVHYPNRGGTPPRYTHATAGHVSEVARSENLVCDSRGCSYVELDTPFSTVIEVLLIVDLPLGKLANIKLPLSLFEGQIWPEVPCSFGEPSPAANSKVPLYHLASQKILCILIVWL